MSEAGSEYEEVDLSENPLYVILSSLLLDKDENNLCDVLSDLVSAVRENTEMLQKVLDKKEEKKRKMVVKKSED